MADGSIDEGSKLVNAFTNNAFLRIPEGQVIRINSPIALPDNATLVGPGLLSLGPTGTISVGNNTVISNVRVDGASNNGADAITVRAGTVGAQVLFTKITNVTGNGVYILDGATKVVVYEPYMSNIGPVGGVNSAITGCGVCVQNAEADVIGGYIEKTWGQGGVSIYGTTRCNVEGVSIRDTFYRAIQTHAYAPQILQNVTIVRNNLQFTGSINNSGSGVGCNGIFAVGNTNVYDLVIKDNYVAFNGENNIEAPTAQIVNNVCRNSNYLSQPTPSPDGIWAGPGSIITDNQIFNSGGCGVKCFQTIAVQNFVIARNRVFSPKSTGYSLQVDQSSGSFLDCVLADNEFYDYNSAHTSLNGYAIIAGNGATLTNFTASNNKTFGIRTINSFSPGVVEYHNSWNTNHSLTLTDGLNRIITTTDSAAGSFIRNMLTYALNYDTINQDFILNSTTNAATAFANGNNLAGLYVVPAGTTGPLTAAQLSTYLVAAATTTGFRVTGSSYADTKLFQIGAYYFWIDSANHLRYKSGAPAFDADGHNVGSSRTNPDVGDKTGLVYPDTRNLYVFNTPLTANRSAIPQTTNLSDGDRIRIVRTIAATGQFALTVSANVVVNLAPGQYVDLEYWGNGGGIWLVTAVGTVNPVRSLGAVTALGALTSNVSINPVLSTTVSLTIGANLTVAFATTGIVPGVETEFRLYVTNGGAFTITWPTGTKWPGGTRPSLTVAGLDILRFSTLDGGTTWYGRADGLNMS